MIQKQLWFNRKFNFLYDADMFPNIVERLRGVPARIEEKVSALSIEQLKKKQMIPGLYKKILATC